MRALALVVVVVVASCTPAQLAAVSTAAPLAIKVTCHGARLIARTCDVLEPLPATSGDETP